MEPQKLRKKTQVLVNNWEEFYNKGMNIITQSPTFSKFILKYIQKKQIFMLKITDGNNIIMKRCNSFQEYQQIQKITTLVTRVLTNETQRQNQKQQVEPQKQKQHKKKKKKNR